MLGALLFQDNIPKIYWGGSIRTAVHLINRTLARLYPFLKLFLSIPYQDLEVFGSLAYAFTLSQNRSKFDPVLEIVFF